MAVKMIDLRCTPLPPGIYCPVCGALIHSEDKGPPGCKHVVFSYIEEFDEFDYVAPSIEEIVAEARERARAGNEDPVEFVLSQLESPSVLCWSLAIYDGDGRYCVAVDFGVE